MAHRNRGGRLQSSLDKEVYTIVRKIIDERAQYSDNASRLSFAQVYDDIRGSNSSLNRRPKKSLEDSIERVLDSIRGDEVNDNEEDGEEEVLDAPTPVRAGTNGLNKSIVGAWSANAGVPNRSGSATPNPTSKREQRDKDKERERQPNGEPVAKRRKTEKSSIDKSYPTHVNFDDMGGIEPIAKELIELLVLPMKRPDFFTAQKLQPTRGILLHGPPGCGKTMLANALAAELKVHFISISAPSIVSGMSGESEKALRDHFEEAKKCAPCLMFIDEIDAVTPKRENAQREMEKRIVAQLLTCMDDLDLAKTDGKPVVVLAATNRPDSLDPGLRRGGRFDKEILMPVPTEKVREQILRSLTKDWNLSEDVDFATLATRTPGCVGADLRDLVNTTVNVAIKRYLATIEEAAIQEAETEAASETQNPHPTAMDIDTNNPKTTPINPTLTTTRALVSYLSTHPTTPINPTTSLITQTDFLTALPQIQPSALREGFATIPHTTFSDIGALTTHISTLRNTLINPILNPTLYASFGLRSTAGILLWGPPGNGKTLLAKAVANASHANFISVKGPELLNKYVGESERSVRTLFSRARSSVPVIIFFDELDALVPRRDGANSEASSRVVNTLLTELDGVGASREGIYIIAATNRPDIIDPAMMRPGRLETLLYVGLPGEHDRVEILRTLTKRLRAFEWTEQMDEIARGCERFSGADLESLVRQASFAAILRYAPNGEVVAPEACKVMVEDFLVARGKVQPSVSIDEHARFKLLQEELGKT
ncbi:Ribosome biogenesis ATPase rix7 [Knufia obscura]|uniref:Ribosome biogenesis ATPase rix7 n=2 Tax=Knufia TaxID=430999 RepID=A0AAN8EIM3_9EURO|nr:Ribosome biogenesis ATPase rix7 [Knufia obscura]KAK5956529.1 Ribosome biogenesis ATPase rix7 [Knufia fluminis]